MSTIPVVSAKLYEMQGEVIDEWCALDAACCSSSIALCGDVGLSPTMFVSFHGFAPPVADLSPPHTYTVGGHLAASVMRNQGYRVRYAGSYSGDLASGIFGGAPGSSGGFITPASDSIHVYMLADSVAVGRGDYAYLASEESDYIQVTAASGTTVTIDQQIADLSDINISTRYYRRDVSGTVFNYPYTGPETDEITIPWDHTIVIAPTGLQFPMIVQKSDGKLTIADSLPSAVGLYTAPSLTGVYGETTGPGAVMLSPTPYPFSVSCNLNCVQYPANLTSGDLPVWGAVPSYTGTLGPVTVTGGTNGYEWSDGPLVDPTIIIPDLLTSVGSGGPRRTCGTVLSPSAYSPWLVPQATNQSTAWSFSTASVSGSGAYSFQSSGPGVTPRLMKQLYVFVQCKGGHRRYCFYFVTYIVTMQNGRVVTAYNSTTVITEGSGSDTTTTTEVASNSADFQNQTTVPWPYINLAACIEVTDDPSFPFITYEVPSSGTITVTP